MKKHILVALLMSLCGLYGLLMANPAFAATYKWVDKNGNVVYSQHPPPSGQYESIRIKSSPRSSSASSSNKPSKGSKWRKDSEKQRQGDNKIKAELEKNKKLRKDNCAKARKQLEIYTVYGRIKQADGSYRPITDSERAAGQTEAKQSIREFCD